MVAFNLSKSQTRALLNVRALSTFYLSEEQQHRTKQEKGNQRKSRDINTMHYRIIIVMLRYACDSLAILHNFKHPAHIQCKTPTNFRRHRFNFSYIDELIFRKKRITKINSKQTRATFCVPSICIVIHLLREACVDSFAREI